MGRYVPVRPDIQSQVPWMICSDASTSEAGVDFHFKLRLHDAMYQLRFYSNSLIHILSFSNSHNNVASIQKSQAINCTV